MEDQIREVIAHLKESFSALLAMPPLSPIGPWSGLPRKGVYLFSEGDLHLYVGRSSQIHKRIPHHHRTGSGYGQAPLATKLAVEALRYEPPFFRKHQAFRELVAGPEFAEAFDQAKRRVRKMDLRVVEEPDPVRQALLEAYVALILRTPYNEF